MADEKKTKTKIPSAKKRDIQSEKNRIRNKAFRAKVSTVMKAFKASDASSAKEKLGDIYSIMDKGVKKGIFKQNKANRIKSRLTKRLAAKS
jgi:small subunit ribosomal protein S20